MPLSLVHTRAALGVQAPAVTVEVHLSNGLPRLSIVGLPETVVRESGDRVRSAILNARFEFPARRITINLAPADLPKGGSRFDLPIAIGILAASGQVSTKELENAEFLGELALSGELRPVPGVLPAACAAARAERSLFLPYTNAAEAALASTVELLPAHRLLEVCNHLQGDAALPRWRDIAPQEAPPPPPAVPDLNEVLGQDQARRALEIAAAGAHNLLFIGPPGVGKTTLASRMPGILPLLDEHAALEVAQVHSIAGQEPQLQHRRRPPFRAPHHTASATALVGGGSNPVPGEISLAHRGVLFLDELPEFPRRVLEVLREPMESGEIRIARARRKVCFPARFQLLAAMNPCPCGYYGDLRTACRCTPDQVRRYRNRISGPFHDRIDLHVELQRIPAALMSTAPQSREASQAVRERVEAARHIQDARGILNAELEGAQLDAHCALGEAERRILQEALEKLGLTMRACHRILRVARTIADLEARPAIGASQLYEALSYRDCSGWPNPGQEGTRAA